MLIKAHCNRPPPPNKIRPTHLTSECVPLGNKTGILRLSISQSIIHTQIIEWWKNLEPARAAMPFVTQTTPHYTDSSANDDGTSTARILSYTVKNELFASERAKPFPAIRSANDFSSAQTRLHLSDEDCILRLLLAALHASARISWRACSAHVLLEALDSLLVPKEHRPDLAGSRVEPRLTGKILLPRPRNT